MQQNIFEILFELSLRTLFYVESASKKYSGVTVVPTIKVSYVKYINVCFTASNLYTLRNDCSNQSVIISWQNDTIYSFIMLVITSNYTSIYLFILLHSY